MSRFEADHIHGGPGHKEDRLEKPKSSLGCFMFILFIFYINLIYVLYLSYVSYLFYLSLVVQVIKKITQKSRGGILCLSYLIVVNIYVFYH